MTIFDPPTPLKAAFLLAEEDRFETTKTSKSRRVFVPTWARSELLNAPSRFGKNWIFPNTQNNNLVKPEVFNEEWARIHAELKIPYGRASNRTPYTCRHTRAAELLTNGVPPAKGAEQLGNSVQVFLATYAEWIEEYSGLDNALLERKIKTERWTKPDLMVLKLVKSLNYIYI